MICYTTKDHLSLQDQTACENTFHAFQYLSETQSCLYGTSHPFWFVLVITLHANCILTQSITADCPHTCIIYITFCNIDWVVTVILYASRVFVINCSFLWLNFGFTKEIKQRTNNEQKYQRWQHSFFLPSTGYFHILGSN